MDDYYAPSEFKNDLINFGKTILYMLPFYLMSPTLKPAIESQPNNLEQTILLDHPAILPEEITLYEPEDSTRKL